MQHKTAIIDDIIAWSGELDILHKSAETPMLRHHGHNAVRSIKRYLEISSQDAPGDLQGFSAPIAAIPLSFAMGAVAIFLLAALTLGASTPNPCREEGHEKMHRPWA